MTESNILKELTSPQVFIPSILATFLFGFFSVYLLNKANKQENNNSFLWFIGALCITITASSGTMASISCYRFWKEIPNEDEENINETTSKENPPPTADIKSN